MSSNKVATASASASDSAASKVSKVSKVSAASAVSKKNCEPKVFSRRSPSVASANRFAGLADPKNYIHNKAEPSVFINKDAAEKAKKVTAAGAVAGPGPNTLKRADFIAARKKSEEDLAFMCSKSKAHVPYETAVLSPTPMGAFVTPKYGKNRAFAHIPRRVSRPALPTSNPQLERQAEVVQANISELFQQKEVLLKQIQEEKNKRWALLRESRGNFAVPKAKEGGQGSQSSPGSASGSQSGRKS